MFRLVCLLCFKSCDRSFRVRSCVVLTFDFPGSITHFLPLLFFGLHECRIIFEILNLASSLSSASIPFDTLYQLIKYGITNPLRHESGDNIDPSKHGTDKPQKPYADGYPCRIDR